MNWKPNGNYDNTYWNHKGIYQNEYNILKQLIPIQGKSKYKNIELLRCMSNIYYDLYNNGGCNITNEKLDKIRNCGFTINKHTTIDELDAIINTIILRILNGE